MTGFRPKASWALLFGASAISVAFAGVPARPRPPAQLQIRSGAAGDRARRAEEAKHRGNLFKILLKEWEAVPDKKEFVKNCTETVTKVVPLLRQSYTSNNVPAVLFHECDVYATTEDFVTENTTQQEKIRSSCRGAARRLGSEFLGTQDYQAWCEEVHQNLEDQASFDRVQKEREDLKHERARIKAELDDLKLQLRHTQLYGNHSHHANANLSQHNVTEMPCCPSGCRVCGWALVPHTAQAPLADQSPRKDQGRPFAMVVPERNLSGTPRLL